MALALNNLKRFDMPLKTKKPNWNRKIHLITKSFLLLLINTWSSLDTIEWFIAKSLMGIIITITPREFFPWFFTGIWVTASFPSLLDSSQHSVRSQQCCSLEDSTHPLISKSSVSFNNPLVTVLITPKIIGIIVTLMFHSFFQFPGKVEVYILLFIFF